MATDPGLDRSRTDPFTDVVLDEERSGRWHAGNRRATAASAASRPLWEARYAATVVVLDVIVLIVVAVLGVLLGLGAAGINLENVNLEPIPVTIAPLAVILPLMSLFLTRA